MDKMSRRFAIRTSSLGLAMSATATLNEGVASAQTTGSGIPTRKTGRAAYSKDLENWMHAQLMPVAARARTGTITSKDARLASGAVRLYANHLQSTQIDKVSKALAARVDPSVTDFSKGPAFAATLAHMQRHDPTLRAQDLAPLVNFSSAAVASGRQSIADNGYSSHFHAVADRFSLVSLALQSKELKAKGRINPAIIAPADYAKSLHAGARTAIYHPGTDAPHFQRTAGWLCDFMQGVAQAIGLSQSTIDGICGVVNDGGIIAALAGLTAAALCGGGEILSILATDGVAAVISGPFETIVCAALEDFAGLKVAAAFATVACALHC